VSGYLRWQAERALGRASSVRPARPLPSFADRPSPSSPGYSSPGYSNAGYSSPVHSSPVYSSPVYSSPAPTAADDHEAVFAAAAPGDFAAAERPFDAPVARTRPAPAGERTGVGPVTSRAPVQPASTMRSDDFSAGAISQDTGAPHRPRPAPPAPSVFPTDRRVTSTEMEHADRAAAGDPPPSARPAIADDRSLPARPAIADDRSLPARLAIADDKTASDFSGRRGSVAPVAPRIAARLARNRPAADRIHGRPEPAASPAPDVHIHIGRVELTAVTPAAPPRRESAANAKKPMSLEEYLRRRSGRPS